MKTVLVFGTFDVLHPGHQWFLQHAAHHGEKLIAVVARDSFVAHWKGQAPITHEVQRIHALKKSGYVDEAYLADASIHTYSIFQKVIPNIICLGHDQIALRNDLELYFQEHDMSQISIIMLPPWKREKYSSSQRNKALRGAGSLSQHLYRKPFTTVIQWLSMSLIWLMASLSVPEHAHQTAALSLHLPLALTALFHFFSQKNQGLAIRGLQSSRNWAIAASRAVQTLLFFQVTSRISLGVTGMMLILGVTLILPSISQPQNRWHRILTLLTVLGMVLLIIGTKEITSPSSLILMLCALSLWCAVGFIENLFQQSAEHREVIPLLTVSLLLFPAVWEIYGWQQQTILSFYWIIPLLIFALPGTLAILAPERRQQSNAQAIHDSTLLRNLLVATTLFFSALRINPTITPVVGIGAGILILVTLISIMMKKINSFCFSKNHHKKRS
ncbi:MAG: adenylyltransferase/cytidyltransferase family protein [Spirochaetales bacterium]|nr:adenylyltransferase/cytidyltransferase family protein [Spirochaetales bacterium]